MKKFEIILLFFILIIFIQGILFSLANAQTKSQAQTQVGPTIQPLSGESWGYFYKQIASASYPKCATGTGALRKITNCITAITNALKYISVLLYVLGLVIIAGYLVFSPFKKENIEKAKKFLLYLTIGFIIIFIADKIMNLIKELASQ